MSSDLLVSEEPWPLDFTVHHGEDWYEPLPQMRNPVNGAPFNITSVTFTLFARPSLNHATRFALLTTTASAGMIKANAALGLLDIFYERTDVEANLPLSHANPWEQFILMNFTDPDLGAVEKLFSVGSLFVMPAKRAATP